MNKLVKQGFVCGFLLVCVCGGGGRLIFLTATFSPNTNFDRNEFGKSPGTWQHAGLLVCSAQSIWLAGRSSQERQNSGLQCTIYFVKLMGAKTKISTEVSLRKRNTTIQHVRLWRTELRRSWAVFTRIRFHGNSTKYRKFLTTSFRVHW